MILMRAHTGSAQNKIKPDEEPKATRQTARLSSSVRPEKNMIKSKIIKAVTEKAQPTSPDAAASTDQPNQLPGFARPTDRKIDLREKTP